jgi:hypothetical protein
MLVVGSDARLPSLVPALPLASCRSAGLAAINLGDRLRGNLVAGDAGRANRCFLRAIPPCERAARQPAPTTRAGCWIAQTNQLAVRDHCSAHRHQSVVAEQRAGSDADTVVALDRRASPGHAVLVARMHGRRVRIERAERLFDRGQVEDAAWLLWQESTAAAEENNSDLLAEIDELSTEMRERLEGDDRLHGFEARLRGEAPAAVEAAEQEAVDVTPLSLGIALVGAGLMLLAVFLPQLETSTYSQIEKNTLIQNGDGWWFIILALLGAGAAYRAFHQQRRTYAPVVLGVIGIGIAVYYGTAHSPRRLCSAASGFTSDCTLATPSIGIYAAGIGAFLVTVGGWQMFRAQQIELDEANTPVVPATASAPASIADRLRTLDQLKADNLITSVEYDQRRAVLLEQV